jgi:hypothetical protein
MGCVTKESLRQVIAEAKTGGALDATETDRLDLRIVETKLRKK